LFYPQGAAFGIRFRSLVTVEVEVELLREVAQTGGRTERWNALEYHRGAGTRCETGDEVAVPVPEALSVCSAQRKHHVDDLEIPLLGLFGAVLLPPLARCFSDGLQRPPVRCHAE